MAAARSLGLTAGSFDPAPLGMTERVRAHGFTNVRMNHLGFQPRARRR